MLVFHWPERSVSFVLPLLFVLAVAVHAGAFYVFQAVYPPVASAMPPAAGVTLITASSPANRALLDWIDSQNPVRAPRLQETTPNGLGLGLGLGEIAYVPSYASARTLPVAAEPDAPARSEPAYPPAYDPLALLSPVSAPRETPRAAVRSSLRFSGPLRQRAPGGNGKDEPLAFSTRATGSLLPSVFLVGIGRQGEVGYVFLQSGSGNRALDEEAERLLARRVFTREEGAAGVEWGFATFAWGADVFAASVPASEPTSASMTASPSQPSATR